MRRLSRPFAAMCALAGLVVVLFGPAGCGRKGSPLPPRPNVPVAVGAFQAEPRDNGILVSWNRPTRNEDGSPLTDLLEFRLYRAVSGPPGPNLEIRPAFSMTATIRAEDPDNATVRGLQYAFRDDDGGAGLTPGLRYGYRVQAVNRRGEAGSPSREVFVEYMPAPEAPVALEAIAGDGTVNLTWHPPLRSPTADGTLLLGYNVYRGVRPGEYAPGPVNPGPVVETRFRDVGVENGRTYSYVVRSVVLGQPAWRESRDSNDVSVTPLDLVPPAPPRGLTAVPGTHAVSLSWAANTEPDLLGYFVYRHDPSALTPARLTEESVQTTTFVDRTARPGVPYTYTVTAVDRSPRRNESAPSAEVEASVP